MPRDEVQHRTHVNAEPLIVPRFARRSALQRRVDLAPEVRRLIEEAEATARKVLTDNLDELHRLAVALLEYETLTGEESKLAIKGEDIGRNDGGARTTISSGVGGSSIPKSKRPKGGWGDPAPQGV